MLLFLIGFMTVTAIKNPYDEHTLNSLEALSLLSSAITVYCGLFYIANSSFKEDKNCKLSDTKAEYSPNDPRGPAFPLFGDRDRSPRIPRLVGLLLSSRNADHD
jgi:hypothetical protein